MSEPQFPWLKWFPRDFRSSTLGWPLIAKGIYRELLDAQWDTGGNGVGTLPDDEEALRLLAGASPAEWRISWPHIAPKFPRVEGGGRRNGRLEEHRRAALEEFTKRRKGAETTNAKRWGHRGNGVTERVVDESQAKSSASRS